MIKKMIYLFFKIYDYEEHQKAIEVDQWGPENTIPLLHAHNTIKQTDNSILAVQSYYNKFVILTENFHYFTKIIYIYK